MLTLQVVDCGLQVSGYALTWKPPTSNLATCNRTISERGWAGGQTRPTQTQPSGGGWEIQVARYGLQAASKP